MKSHWEKEIEKEPLAEKRFFKILEEARSINTGTEAGVFRIRDTLLLATADFLEKIYYRVIGSKASEFAKKNKFSFPHRGRNTEPYFELTIQEVCDIIGFYEDYIKCHF